MSAYYLICTTEKVQNSNITMPNGKSIPLELWGKQKELGQSPLLPIYFYEDRKNYFYFLSIESLTWHALMHETDEKDENGDPIYLLRFPTEQEEQADGVYKRLYQWIKAELQAGNQISLCQLTLCNHENKELEEATRERYNSLYQKEFVSIDKLLQDDSEQDFTYNTEYEFFLQTRHTKQNSIKKEIQNKQKESKRVCR